MSAGLAVDGVSVEFNDEARMRAERTIAGAASSAHGPAAHNE